ncbi:hypothetical protein KBB96_06070 [Luteolibacter ambystomatis]|uniref:Uncharacterized protein n=1 Tax=Luteolibacter ambystomatis TaxID=2824561 RepID=A0A975J1S7_9BACT|nr:hypothetical protein [Luteolibacter ambystomatis]QUE52456.1 hypothetical protein KBB96_06070 [Luteolibacter ambystomatis]
MKSFLPVWLAALPMIVGVAMAQQPGEPKALTDLRSVYEAQSKAIMDKYRAALAELEKSQVRQSKTLEVLATRKEINAAGTDTSRGSSSPDLSLSPLAGKKFANRTQGTSIIELHADGTWIEHWSNHSDQHGKWSFRADNPRIIHVDKEGGGGINYRIGDDNRFFYRMGDGFLYMPEP